MKRIGQTMDSRVQIKFYRETDNPLPEYQNKGDAGMDIRSNEDVSVRGFHWETIGTGLYIIIPFGYEGQMRSRSGLAVKHGVHVLNSPGTIDSGYRDELKVILMNHNHWAYEVKKGDRIAQLVISPMTQAQIEEISEMDRDDDRGGGFGSTGVK
jgi:dUTP pyrophosphatase